VNGDYDGRQVVGLDLHRNRTVMVRTTEQGERLETVRFRNDREGSRPREWCLSRSPRDLGLDSMR
jgi:hypothetical protein